MTIILVNLSSYPMGDLEKDRRSYILGYFLVKEPVNAEAEYSLVIHFVKLTERLSLCLGFEDQIVIRYNCAESHYVTDFCINKR